MNDTSKTINKLATSVSKNAHKPIASKPSTSSPGVPMVISRNNSGFIPARKLVRTHSSRSTASSTTISSSTSRGSAFTPVTSSSSSSTSGASASRSGSGPYHYSHRRNSLSSSGHGSFVPSLRRNSLSSNCGGSVTSSTSTVPTVTSFSTRSCGFGASISAIDCSASITSHTSCSSTGSSSHASSHASILQRSNAKFVKQNVKVIADRCNNATHQGSEQESEFSFDHKVLAKRQKEPLPTAPDAEMRMLLSCATDPYYQVVLAKCGAIPVIVQAMRKFMDKLPAQATSVSSSTSSLSGGSTHSHSSATTSRSTSSTRSTPTFHYYSFVILCANTLHKLCQPTGERHRNYQLVLKEGGQQLLQLAYETYPHSIELKRISEFFTSWTNRWIWVSEWMIEWGYELYRGSYTMQIKSKQASNYS